VIGAFLLLLAAVASQPAERRPVDVRATGEDALTQRLSDALIESLGSAKKLRAADGDDKTGLSLVILGDVTPKGDRFDYMVDLVEPGSNLSSRRLASMSGTCREAQLARCAADIVARAERKVGG